MGNGLKIVPPSLITERAKNMEAIMVSNKLMYCGVVKTGTLDTGLAKWNI